MRTLLLLLVAVSACTRSPSHEPEKQPAQAHENAPAQAHESQPAATAAAATTPQYLGAAIPADAPVVALADIVKDPAKYKNKPFVTTGTVTAVCQEMGCWMEIKDDSSEAHVKMAGEKFFVPKDSAGRKARVAGMLVEVADEDEACAAEAAKQTGKQVAKLQLEATGVELD